MSGGREGVARNPNTPTETLQDLAKDRSDSVREAVAGNPSTPSETLRRLAGDKREARKMVADNPKAPIRLLRHMVGDGDRYARMHAKQQMLALLKQGCLKAQLQNLLTEEGWDYINLACEDLALWLIYYPPSHEATVDLPAHLLERKDVLGAIVWLCRVPQPSLEEAQSHGLYGASAKYRAAVAAVYGPQISWFDRQLCEPHLLPPVYP